MCSCSVLHQFPHFLDFFLAIFFCDMTDKITSCLATRATIKGPHKIPWAWRGDGERPGWGGSCWIVAAVRNTTLLSSLKMLCLHSFYHAKYIASSLLVSDSQKRDKIMEKIRNAKYGLRLVLLTRLKQFSFRATPRKVILAVKGPSCLV